MGAIYGIVGEANPHELAAMNERLSHRGLRSDAVRVASNCWFGTRSNLLASGRFQLDDLSLVADATIYNAAELRARIEAAGHVPDDQTIEALVAAAYRSFGMDSFRLINGDFAIAIWDHRDHSLVLARDPLGFRPLYYCTTPATKRIVFASEYKALLALDDVPAEPDLAIIQHLHHAKFPPPDRSLLTGIASVPPGHWIKFAGRDAHCKRFWSPVVDVRERSEAESAAFIRTQLLQAVKRRVGDIGVVGVTLSSGIDSAAVVATVRQAYPDMQIHTFTAGHGPSDPEMIGAAEIADHYGTIHHPVEVEPERIPEVMPGLVWHLEDPVARNEVVFLHEAIRSGVGLVEIMLSGCGPDTLFGGMQKYKIVQLSQYMPPFRRALTEFYNYSQVSTEPQTMAGRMLKTMYYRGSDPPVPRVNGIDYVPTTTELPAREPEALNHFLASGLLAGYRSVPKFERLHMAHGLEFRAPFFDLDLIPAAYQVPSRYKIRGWREKHIFREALAAWLPDTVLNRPKHPTRMNSDLRFSEVLEHYSRSILTPAAIRGRGLFEPRAIEQLLTRSPGRAYSFGHAMRIWTLVMTELWARAFLDRRGASLVQAAAAGGPPTAPNLALA